MRHLTTALLAMAACNAAPSDKTPDTEPQPWIAASVETVANGLPGADGIAWLDDGRLVVSAPTADQLWAIDPATGETALYSEAVSEPYGLARHANGDLLVANWGAKNALQITPDRSASVLAETTDWFGNIYVDPPTGDVYLPAFASGQLERITDAGVRETVSTGVVDGGLHGVMFDDERTMYTGYVRTGEIYRHDADGTPTLLATLPGSFGNLLWVDGLLLASSWETHRIYTVDADGRVDRWAGRPQAGEADGTGDDALFDSPNGLLLDGTTLYVTESVGRVRRIELVRAAG